MAINTRALVTRYRIDGLDTARSEIRQTIGLFDREGRRSAQGFAGSIGGITVAAGAASVAIGGLAAVARRANREFSNFEQAIVNFQTLTQSLRDGEVVFNNILDLAQRTPFSIPDAIDGTRRLLAFGASAREAAEELEIIGNIAAGVGRDRLPNLILAFGQVRTATRLTGQELRQFAEAGVPLLDLLSRQSGISAREIVDNMRRGIAPSFNDVREALRSTTEEGGRFFQLLQRQSETLAGQTQILSDQFTVLFANIGESIAPLTRTIVNSLSSITQSVNSLFDGDRVSQFNQRVSEVTLQFLRLSTGSIRQQQSAFNQLQGRFPDLISAEEQIGDLLDRQVEVRRQIFNQIRLQTNREELASQIGDLNAELVIAEEAVTGFRLAASRVPPELEGASQAAINAENEINQLRLTEAIAEVNRLRSALAALNVQAARPTLPTIAISDVVDEDFIDDVTESVGALEQRIQDLSSAGLIDGFRNFQRSLADIDNALIDNQITFRTATTERRNLISSFVSDVRLEESQLNEFLEQLRNRGFLSETNRLNILAARRRELINQDTNDQIARNTFISQITSNRELEIQTQAESRFQRARELREQAILDEQQFSDAVVAIEAAKNRSILSMQLTTAGGVASSLGALSQVFANESRSAFEFSKAFNIAAAIMNTASAVTQALPNIPLAVAAGVTGAAQIATIARTRFGGTASAGPSTIPSISSISGITARGTSAFTPDQQLRQAGLESVSDTDRIVNGLQEVNNTIAQGTQMTLEQNRRNIP